MRDIRSDLQERATLIDEQIRAVFLGTLRKPLSNFNERDARKAALKSGLAMIAKFMEFDQRFSAN